MILWKFCGDSGVIFGNFVGILALFVRIFVGIFGDFVEILKEFWWDFVEIVGDFLLVLWEFLI